MSIEDVPRWWPGLISGSGGLFGLGGGVRWVRLNDDDPIPACDIPHKRVNDLASRHFSLGDAAVFKDGEFWGCIRGGSFETARMVRARQV